MKISLGLTISSSVKTTNYYIGLDTVQNKVVTELYGGRTFAM